MAAANFVVQNVWAIFLIAVACGLAVDLWAGAKRLPRAIAFGWVVIFAWVFCSEIISKEVKEAQQMDGQPAIERWINK